MGEKKEGISSHWWWFNNQNHHSVRRSTWLQSTLAELDEKTKAILNLIEEDGDSFAQRAEMYYKKRPELVSMVEDVYRAHRSLAERYDQMKTESLTRLLTPRSTLSFPKYQLDKLASPVDKSYDSYSETYDPADSSELEIDDPDQEEESAHGDKEAEEEEVSSRLCNDEVMKLREEIERLREENMVQKEQLLQKDEEKREVIRQLSLALDAHKKDNEQLRKIFKDFSRKQSNFEFSKLRKSFLGKLFNVPPNSKVPVVAL